MKKILTILLVFVFAFSLVSCGEDTSSNGSGEQGQEKEQTDESNEQTDESDAQTDESDEEEADTDKETDEFSIDESLEGVELAKECVPHIPMPENYAYDMDLVINDIKSNISVYVQGEDIRNEAENPSEKYWAVYKAAENITYEYSERKEKGTKWEQQLVFEWVGLFNREIMENQKDFETVIKAAGIEELDGKKVVRINYQNPQKPKQAEFDMWYSVEDFIPVKIVTYSLDGEIYSQALISNFREGDFKEKMTIDKGIEFEE